MTIYIPLISCLTDTVMHHSYCLNIVGSDYLCHLLEPYLDVRPSQDAFWMLIIRKGSTKGEIVYRII